jgi:hypothetical protein
MDRLADDSRYRPWDRELQDELEQIAARAREIAGQRGRLAEGIAAAKGTVTPGRLITDALVAMPTLASVVVPGLSWVAVLGVGKLLLGTAKPAAAAAIDAMLAYRPAEHNAVTFLLNARHR